MKAEVSTVTPELSLIVTLNTTVVMPCRDNQNFLVIVCRLTHFNLFIARKLIDGFFRGESCLTSAAFNRMKCNGYRQPHVLCKRPFTPEDSLPNDHTAIYSYLKQACGKVSERKQTNFSIQMKQYFYYVKYKMNLAYEIQTLQITLPYSRWPSLVIRLLFIQIQFSGNALDLILATGENDT